VIRLRATDPAQRIGSLVVNPGGPGVSALDSLPRLYFWLTPALRQHFDVVAFDPPGVGHSQAVRCLDGPGLDALLHLDPGPPDPAGFAALVDGARRLAAGCEALTGRLLGHVSTADAARGMDQVRQALGDPKLTYLGFSYGSFLGATYAELFPDRVRALVLDGALDPALAPVTVAESQAAALDAQFTTFQKWCAGMPQCPWQPAGLSRAADFAALEARVRARPLTVPGTTRTVGPGELFYGTAAGLYEPATWNDEAAALAEADRGDGTELIRLFDSYVGRNADGTYQPLLEAEVAVNCLDAPSPSIDQLRAAEPAAAAAAPDFGVGDLLGELDCAVWPLPATAAPHPIKAAGAPPIVVVATTADPITPYQWGKALAGELERGVLLTRVGEGHTAYAASACVRRLVDTYMIDLGAPPAGSQCPSDG